MSLLYHYLVVCGRFQSNYQNKFIILHHRSTTTCGMKQFRLYGITFHHGDGHHSSSAINSISLILQNVHLSRGSLRYFDSLNEFRIFWNSLCDRSPFIVNSIPRFWSSHVSCESVLPNKFAWLWTGHSVIVNHLAAFPFI
jgi:hypothetical protein